MELLKEISELVQIRQYLSNTMGNPTLDRKTVTIMNNTLLLLDRKIVDLLQSAPFQNYIGYGDVAKVVQKAANLSNIKYGLKDKT